MPRRKRKSNLPSNPQKLDLAPKRKCTQPREERNPPNVRESSESCSNGTAHHGTEESHGDFWGRTVQFEDLAHMTQESLRAERVNRRHSRALQHNVLHAVKTFNVQDLLSVKKTPEELHKFLTANSESLPLLHLICQHSRQKPINHVLEFLSKIPDLEVISEQLSATGERAGKQFEQEALIIMCAACERHEHIHIVRAMIKAGTEVNAFFNDSSPLMIASMCDNTEAIKLLVKHKACVDLPNSKNETSLLLACRRRQWAAARVLLDCHANVFHADEKGDTAFHATISGGCVELIQHMAGVSHHVSRELQHNVSTEALIRIGYNAPWLDTYLNGLPEHRLNTLVPVAIQHKNTAALQQLAPKLTNHSLTTHINEAYRAGHYEGVDALAMCCRGRSEQPRPDIALCETCKHPVLIHLTCLLVENGADVNEGNGEPLRLAAKYGHLKAVMCLIENKACIDAADTQGLTPLIQACAENHLDVVYLLLKHGANVHTCGEPTPLSVACKQNNVKLLHLLMQNNPAPDLTETNEDGMTPLHVAIVNKHFALAIALLAYGARLTSWSSITLRQLCLVGNADLVNRFLQDTAVAECKTLDEKVVDAVMKPGNSVLLNNLLESDKVSKSQNILTYVLGKACKTGRTDIIETLSKIMQFDIDDVDSHLNHAIRHHHLNVVHLLLKYGCDPGKVNCSLTEAIKCKPILKELLKYDLPDGSLRAALLAVCTANDMHDDSCVRLLLDKIKDVNYDDDEQTTPLLAACLKSSVSLVKLLLSKGADPNHSDEWQRTPLYVACETENREIASLLLNNKHNPANPNVYGIPLDKSPLWISCSRGYLDLVTLLLEKEAHKKLLAAETGSLLSESQNAGHHEVVRLLLEDRTDYSALTNIDLQTACQLGYAELALVLCEKESIKHREECIEAACTNGFPETALGIVLKIDDIETQKRCFRALERTKKHESQHSLSPSSGKPEDLKVREDKPLWQSLLCNEKDRFKELIEEGHDPNAKNESGTPLLHVATQMLKLFAVEALLGCPKTDINLRDEIGRTAIFYALNSPYILSRLVDKGADMVVTDNFGRMLVHEWKPTTSDSLITGKLNLCDNANKTDCKGQTPLHLAVLQENSIKVRILLDNNSDPNAMDKNGITPIELSKRYPDIHGIFATSFPELQKPDEDESTNPRENISVHFSNEYQSQHRVVWGLSKFFHEAKSKDSDSLFQDNFQTPLVISKEKAFKEEMATFCDTIIRFMTDLSKAIQKEDPLMAFTPVLSGSCSEGTKVVEMNEADVLCRFTDPEWEKIVISNHEHGDFSYMKLESEKLAAKFPKLFNANTLSVHAVFRRFYSAVRRHVAEVLAHYNNLYIVDVQSILANQHAITPLEFVWSGKLFTWQMFSVDVVPAFPVPEGKIPKGLKNNELIHDLVVVPKWTASLIDKQYTDEAFQLGFSMTEKDFFYAMPIALRQGYMLAKVAKDKCIVINDLPADQFFSSYMLKCKMFECFAEMAGFSTAIKKPEKRNLFDDELQPPKDVLYWANKILQKLEDNVTEQKLESYFLPGSNLLARTVYDYLALIYVQMCRAMINSLSDNPTVWSRLAITIAQQLFHVKNRSPDECMKELTLLLEMGLDPNFHCPKGCSLMYYMIEQGLEEVEFALTEWQASLENADGHGNNAIHVAVEMKKDDITKFLLENTAVTVDQKPAFRLPVRAHPLVGMNSQGEILLVEYEGSRLFIYASSRGEFTQRWCHNLPRGIAPYCHKVISSSGQALLQNLAHGETVMIREDGTERRWQHDGRLVASLPGDRRVYAQGMHSGDFEVVILEQQGERRLNSPQGLTWSGDLSVCASGDNVAVVDAYSSKLSIFKHQNPERTISLGYEPAWENAVCCSNTHVYVTEYRSSTIHIHSWAGTHTQSLSLEVDGGDVIWGLAYISRDNTLQAAVRRWEREDAIAHSLLSLQVHLKYSPEEMAIQKEQIEEQTRRWEDEHGEVPYSDSEAEDYN